MSEGLEALKRVVEWFEIENVKDIETIEKELRALEIIKPFLKNLRLEQDLDGGYEVMIDVINSDRPLVIARLENKEKYDLLKEVGL